MPSMIDILNYALDNDMLDLSIIREKIQMQKKEQILSKHPHAIWQGSNGYWYTHVGKGNERKKVRKKSREVLEEYLLTVYDNTKSFKEYFGLWVERQEICNRSDNTIMKYQSDYKRFIEGKEFELLKIDEITDEDIAALLKAITADKKYTFKSIQTLFGYIKGVMDKAVRDRVINENPCKYVDLEMFKKSCKEEAYHSDEERTLSKDERKILAEKLQNKHITKPYYIPAYAVELSTLTGMRVGELTGLKWEDVFWDKKMILIRHSEKYNRRTNVYTVEDTKNFKHREFPLTDEIEKLLKLVWKRESEKGWLCEYVFADDTGHIHKNKVSSAMRNYTLYDDRFEYAKSIHANRRTINSNMRCSGISAVVTSSLLGNTIQCNTNNYTYDTTEAEYKAAVVTKANAL